LTLRAAASEAVLAAPTAPEAAVSAVPAASMIALAARALAAVAVFMSKELAMASLDSVYIVARSAANLST